MIARDRSFAEFLLVFVDEFWIALPHRFGRNIGVGELIADDGVAGRLDQVGRHFPGAADQRHFLEPGNFLRLPQQLRAAATKTGA